MKSAIRAGLKGLLRAGVSMGLLAWFVTKSDPRHLLASLTELSPVAWAMAFAMYIASQIISSARWRLLAHALDFSGPFMAYLRYYFVGMYFNLFLPTSVGGDIYKIMLLTRGAPKRLRATYSIFADRLFGLFAMFLLGAGAVLWNQDLLPASYRAVLVGTALVFLAAPLVLLLSFGFIRKLWPELSDRLGLLVIFLQRPKTFAMALGYSLTMQALGMGAVALLAHSMKLPPPAGFFFAAFPLVAVMTLLPISFNGLGIREGGFIYFLGLKGIASEKALTLSLYFFSVQVAASLIGGLLYTLGAHKVPETKGMEAASQ